MGICLITESVSRLVSFYEKVFGVDATGDDQHAEFCIGGVNLAIFSKKDMEQLAQGSMRGAGYGSFTLGFKVEDVDFFRVICVYPRPNHWTYIFRLVPQYRA
jgi:predicted enzyme related to lactoylglutathione lyase